MTLGGSWRALSRRYASTSRKPFYITTPIFYVNAKPHLGHLYSMLMADVRHRWEKLGGNQLFMMTGTDEHGLKIQAVAEKQGISPKELCDTVSENFKQLATMISVDYDRFIRTTDADHVAAVKHFWTTVADQGLLYQGSHAGWYSVSDETFFPETQIERSEDGRMISKETRNEVVYQEETNWFFRLSAFQDQLIAMLEDNPQFVIPQSKYHLVLNELKLERLPDLSVSRPASRLTWGIEVPDDPLQRIYVWFDALINYITAAGYPQVGVTAAKWPATHIVGKDIMRFHCIYWPIFLMAARQPVPEQVVVHAHWLSEGFKMSKSLGNVVDPVATYEHYGEDALRLFLTEHTNIDSDCNFSETAFHDLREMLIGKYANLVTRVGGKKFDIATAVSDYHKTQFAGIEDHIRRQSPEKADQIIMQSHQLQNDLNSLYANMDPHMRAFTPKRALASWWLVLDSANLIFQLGEPWAIKNDPELKSFYTFLAAETCRIALIVVSPIIPQLSNAILDRLAVTTREIDSAVVGGDKGYGKNANNPKAHSIPITRVPQRGIEE